jgi:Zn finger protein HypA/HybF involved in hydrogenase expression
MTGVEIPNDRTIKQPAVAFCRNPACRDVSNREFSFVVEHSRFECPKCGANQEPMIGLYVLTHLLIPVKNGPVIGSYGRRYAIACDQKRAYLATVTNLEAATDQIAVANCPACQERAKQLNITRPLGAELVMGSKPK